MSKKPNKTQDLQDNPWTTLSSKVVYENPWLSFREDKVINPSGGEGIYGVASLKTIGVSVIPIDEDGNIWIVGQYRYPLEKYTWEICSGGVASTEDTLEGAKRELLEELGIQATKWTELARLDVSNSVTDAIGIIYVAQDLSFGSAHNDEIEDIEIRKIAFEDALGWLEPNLKRNVKCDVISEEISDVTSTIGLLKLALLRNEFGL